tara:strand:+ start:3083 stop:4345 length:1263 start_codon:yes stop_codon:yes gene_type:complete
MKLLAFIAIAALSFSGNAKIPKFDSAASRIYDLKIQNAKLAVFTTHMPLIKEQITSQLSFLVGFFNHYNSGPLLSHAKFEVISVKEDQSGRGKFIATYNATIPVAWNNRNSPVGSMQVTLPHRAGPQFYGQFLNAMDSGNLSNCHDHSGALSTANLFYHFRPNNSYCNFSDEAIANEYVFKLAATFTPSALQTSDKAPEYKKLWADGLLDVFLVFAKDKPYAANQNDVGSISYYETIRALYREYSSERFNFALNEQLPKFVQIEKTLSNGQKIRIVAMLVEKVSLVSQSEINTIKAYSTKADYVMYNGHAGLGSNIDQFIRLVDFPRARYQVYFLNGCDTFSYYPTQAMTRVERMNPGDKASKWLDLISNGMPAYFHTMAPNTMAVLRELVKQRASYRDILSQIDDYQNAAVMGEEDNLY